MQTTHSINHCVVQYVGFQPGLTPGSGFNLYNFIEPEGAGIPVGSTVTAKRLKQHGFTQATIRHGDTQREERMV